MIFELLLLESMTLDGLEAGYSQDVHRMQYFTTLPLSFVLPLIRIRCFLKSHQKFF